MVAVGHKSRTPYLPTDPDAEYGDRLVAYEADQGSRRYRPHQLHGLRIDDPLYGLVSGHHRAEEDDQHDEHPGQVLHPPIPEREAPAGSQTAEREGDP